MKNLILQPNNEKKLKLNQAIKILFGSWKSDMSGDQLAKKIYNERQDSFRDIQL